ncbi:MAG: phenylalanine--tRNA ligase beta subunit-related protein [Cyclonatronaceae bacterium]
MNHVSLISPVKMLAGVVEARAIIIDKKNGELDERLARLLENRKSGTGGQAEAFRLASRDMLRNGSYKPTGRAKPASEYLLRAAQEGHFPRINTAVDINNYISLNYMVPISLWDIDKAGGRPLTLDLGQAGEKYVFNESGQEIDLKDLVCGVLTDDGSSRKPVINPVKDSMFTKTDAASQNVGYLVYYPASAGSRDHLMHILDELAELLGGITEEPVNRGIAESTEK